MLHPERVRDALAGVKARGPVVQGTGRRAGVAIILAGDVASPSVCFMRRVARHGDRWSGDVAFPGGWAKAGERHLKETAVRETFEEVGIALAPEQHVGDVPPLPVSRHGGSDIIGASAFWAGTSLPAMTLDPREVADAFWIRCEDLYDPANRTSVRWSRTGPALPRPAVRVDGHTIWGLTYRVLVRFSELVLGARSPLPVDADDARRPGA